MNTTENLCLVTAQAEFTDAALAELKALDKNLTIEEEIAPGIILCGAANVARLMNIASNEHPTFARHIAPVQVIIDLENNEQDIGALALAIVQLPGMALLERGTHFAVQTRLMQTDKSQGERAYSGGQINKELAEALVEETGAIEDVKKPLIVISLLCTMNKGYLGISTAEANLSSWPGGARHYAQTSEQVSRAEFKLLEALEVFGVTLPTRGQALDLGAAPGGWTRLLLEAGLQVVAVDPARLDPRLDLRKGLEHYRGYAEDYLEEAVKERKKYDLIVNDMRMDAREAARLISRASSCLKEEDGFMLSVFKLPHAALDVDPFINLKEALTILRRSYKVVQAHQLFHNRQEVTVVAAQPIPQPRMATPFRSPHSKTPLQSNPVQHGPVRSESAQRPFQPRPDQSGRSTERPFQQRPSQPQPSQPFQSSPTQQRGPAPRPFQSRPTQPGASRPFQQRPSQPFQQRPSQPFQQRPSQPDRPQPSRPFQPRPAQQGAPRPFQQRSSQPDRPQPLRPFQPKYSQKDSGPRTTRPEHS